MRRMLHVTGLICLAALLFQLNVSSQTGVTLANFANFEAAQTSPIRVSPDGTRLFAVNTPDARVSVFDLTAALRPALIAEIPVGVEPVSVQPRSNDEAWVVNQVSDSISVVSVSRGVVTDTIQVKDEPSDVVFAGAGAAFAFVSVSRSNEVRVFDAGTHAEVARIPLEGESPRALAVSADGSRVYAAFALSGNRTTIVPESIAPPQPPPANEGLPDPPSTSLIVDAQDPAWTGVVRYTMPDNDVAEIDAAARAVTRYFPGAGTVNFGIAVHAQSGDLYVTNTDSRNLTRFETALRGHIVDHRVTRISTGSGTMEAIDLNPGVDYGVLPNPAAKATALATPTAIVSDTAAGGFYIAAFGTDRVAHVGADGAILTRIDVAPAVGGSTRAMRGPRGLAVSAATGRLYVLNRISNTIGIVDAASDALLGEVPVGSFDPTPPVIRQGRGFLYDARLSGNGTVACASCHVDGDMDMLAWDLGAPDGEMQVVQFLQMHPMKGPMTTQTLRGLRTLEPFHWRGDRADFLAFNPAFDKLMGGTPLPDADMAAYRDYIETLRFQPNPNRNLDGSLPPVIGDGDPVAGRNTFLNEPFTPGITCNLCHNEAAQGTVRLIIPGSLLQEPQSFKVPHLRNLYQKTRFNKTDGARTVGGFGFIHDGSISTLFEFLSLPVFDDLSTDTVRKRNVAAFLLAFDTGAAPAVGYSRTVTAANAGDSGIGSDWTILEQQAAASKIELIAKGTIDGELHGLLYRPTTNDYRSDRTGLGPFTRAALLEKIAAGDTLTVTGVPPGSGTRMGLDRNLDGVLDGNVGLPPPPQTVHVADIITTDAAGNIKTTFRRRDTVSWRVLVVDADAAPVGGASVQTEVRFGTAVVAAASGTTATDGWAIFNRPAQNDTTGTYTIAVTSVSATDATYDPAANVKSSTVYTLKR